MAMDADGAKRSLRSRASPAARRISAQNARLRKSLSADVEMLSKLHEGQQRLFEPDI